MIVGLDCLKYGIPIRAGGLHDQPMLQMHHMKIAINTYEAVKAYRTAQNNLKADALSKWYGANSRLMKFMEYVWKLQGVFEDNDG